MNYRMLGNTGLRVSEIGLGAEWLERHTAAEVAEVVACCHRAGVNILDCWMPGPAIRSNLGAALRGMREQWVIQGHLGATWQNGQYERTRDLAKVRPAFEDLLRRLETDYIDLGMIHYVDDPAEYRAIMADSPYLRYVLGLKKSGVIRHIGLSTHNAAVAQLAAESGLVEMLLFSLNPAFDLFCANEEMNLEFAPAYDENLHGMSPERERLYRTCEQRGVGITVMKTYAGGRLFSAGTSPFGAALTPVQCLHYALTRPAVASALVGYDTPQHVAEALAYETATEAEKDYASVLAAAPHHAWSGACTYCGHCAPCPKKIDIAMVNKLYDLAVMQPEVPDGVRGHYRALAVGADACIACGGCEKRCPFGVPVIERMRRAALLFG